MSDDDVEMMIRLVRVAQARFDGCLTIIRSSTTWRVAFEDVTGHQKIGAMPSGPTLFQAGLAALSAVGEPI